MKSEPELLQVRAAWQSVLGQLREQLPRGLFDTWVADTLFLEADDDSITIGCRNTCTRVWLENRVQSSASSWLAGMLNRSVDVRFVVMDVMAARASVSKQEAELVDDDVQVEAAWDSVYDQVVQPEKSIALNAYFLRHLRELGPELGWMYIGFRQAAYSAGGRKGSRIARFTGKSIALLSGTPERTFWSRAGVEQTWKRLAGLVTPVHEKPLWDEKSGTPKRLPRKYSVAMTLPLTAVDTRALMRWIAENLEQAGSPAAVLSKACQTSLAELIPSSAERPENSEAMSVSRIVRDLFADEIPEMELNALAEKLRNHLMPPGELVMISLFFIEHVLPHLGPGPGWMLTILRDRCWVNPDSGETRSRVTVKAGYFEIAGWMGLERAMTVYEWLNGRHRNMLPVKNENGQKTSRPNPRAGQYLNPGLRIYIREAETGKAANFKAGQREFDVLLEEIPAEIVSAAIEDRPLFPALDDPGPYANFSIGFTQLADDFYANCSIDFTRITQHLYAACRVFKLLNSLKPDLKPLLKTSSDKSAVPAPLTELPVQKQAPGVEWNLSTLLYANGVSQKKQRQLLESNAAGLTFASWILYGYTSAGRGLNDLVANAIQSSLAAPHSGAGGICDQLAGYGPQKLIPLLVNSIRGVAVNDQPYLTAFGQLPLARKQELLMRLGEKRLDVPESAVVDQHRSGQESLSGLKFSLPPENLEKLRELLVSTARHQK